MNPDVLKYMYDIQDSINIIESHLSSIPSLIVYKNELKTIDAVERRLAIIGEALGKAAKIESLNISNMNKIIGLRHILVHDYDLIDDEAIWTICKKYLSLLKEEVTSILNSHSS